MKSITAYCIVKKKNPRILPLEIYDTKDVIVGKDEKVIKVRIIHIDDIKK